MNDRELADELLAHRGSEASVPLLARAAAAIDANSTDFADAVTAAWTAETRPVAASSKSEAGGSHWSNWAGNEQFPVSRRLDWPCTDEVAQIAAAIRDAEQKNTRFRAMGSGHSYSDIVEASNAVVLLPASQNMPGMLDAAPGRLVVEHLGDAFVRVRGGALLSAVVEELWAAGHAFQNLGGFLGQTVAGALAGSTHGSGIELPPIADSVVALDIVTSGGRLVRIQSADLPLSDADVFGLFPGTTPEVRRNNNDLIAARVALGAFGVVYAVTLRVLKAYKLSECRTITTWDAVKPRLEQLVATKRHVEVWLSPYTIGSSHRAILVTRDLASVDRPDQGRPCDFPQWLASRKVTQAVIAWLMRTWPGLIPFLMNLALGSMAVADRVGRYYDVLSIGWSNDIVAYSCEHTFPAKDAVHVCDEFLDTIHANWNKGLFHTAYVSLRFIANAAAWMSMFNGRTGGACSVEMPLLKGASNDEKVWETFDSYQHRSLQLGGRPHWAQYWELDQNALGELLRGYRNADAWKAACTRMNTSGVFDNAMTDKMGLRSTRPTEALTAGRRVPGRKPASTASRRSHSGTSGRK